MRTVADVMTDTPFVARPTDLVGPTRDAMLDGGMHCLPVVDDAGHPVGIVTSWDLVEEYAPQESIENAMTRNVRTIGVHQSAVEAASMMRSEFLHHLVVVDAGNTIAGVLSSLDLLSLIEDGQF